MKNIKSADKLRASTSLPSITSEAAHGASAPRVEVDYKAGGTLEELMKELGIWKDDRRAALKHRHALFQADRKTRCIVGMHLEPAKPASTTA